MKYKVYHIDIIDASEIDDKNIIEFFNFLIDNKVDLKYIKWIYLGEKKFYEREFVLLLKLIISQFSNLVEHNMSNPFKIWWKTSDGSNKIEPAST